MRHQAKIGNVELKTWLNVGSSLGKNDSLIDAENTRLVSFLKGYDEVEVGVIENLISVKLDLSNEQLSYTPTVIRLLLIKKFIDFNNPSIIAEFLGYGTLSGAQLEKRIFIDLVERIFKGHFVNDIFAYCIFRKRGSPTTWLQISDELSDTEIKQKVDAYIEKMCRRLTSKLKKHRKLRLAENCKGYQVYIIEKPTGVKVITSEDTNIEAQTASYSLLVIDFDKKRIGYISGSNKEIFIVQHYIKNTIFINKAYTVRNDVIVRSKDLLEKLLLQNVSTALELVGLELKQANLPGNPSLKIRSTDDSSIEPALSAIQGFLNRTDIANVKNIEYLLQRNKVNIYSFGDEWERRRINIASKGKSDSLEQAVLSQLDEILECKVKETRFITRTLSLEEIIDKLLRLKFIQSDLPLAVEEVIIDLVKKRLIKKPRKVSKRRCSNWSCSGTSWEDLSCPVCGREMIVLGENITIDITESSIIGQLETCLRQNLLGYQIVKQRITRNKYPKSVLRFVNKSKDVAIYAVVVSTKKDINHCKLLSKEGYGILAICDPKFTTKREDLESSGCEFIELSKVISYLKQKLTDTTDLQLRDLFGVALLSQEQDFLSRVYELQKTSTQQLEGKPSSYTEDDFEIDLKNVIQALVPNVVRLGTQFKGKSVPDGYCSFRKDNTSNNFLFGWDAKYSYSQAYSLGGRDLIKQRRYIKWLTSDPEPKSLGKLRIYGFISNFSKLDGFKTVLTDLRKSPEKPRNCRIVLIQDLLLVEIGKWMMANSRVVIDKGPSISHTFFNWLISSRRRMIDRWIVCGMEDWESLKIELEKI